MGTSYTVKITAAETIIEQEQIQAAVELILDKVNNEMSSYLPDSTISKINRNKTTDWQALTPGLYAVIHQALEIGIVSRGAFDITTGALVNLWGFGPDGRTKNLPADEAVRLAMQRSGLHHIQLSHSPPLLRKDIGDLYLDLSAIAKGYGVDMIANYLDGLGIDNYMVEIGGEIKAKGVNREHIPWRIGIEKPTKNERHVQTVIHLHNIGMASSGDYRNYYEQDATRYSHTINPASGRPVTHNLAAVTVLHESTAMADGLATALLVLGLEEGYELAEEEDMAALFIYHTDEGFQEKITPQFRPYLLPSRQSAGLSKFSQGSSR